MTFNFVTFQKPLLTKYQCQRLTGSSTHRVSPSVGFWAKNMELLEIMKTRPSRSIRMLTFTLISVIVSNLHCIRVYKYSPARRSGQLANLYINKYTLVILSQVTKFQFKHIYASRLIKFPLYLKNLYLVSSISCQKVFSTNISYC